MTMAVRGILKKEGVISKRPKRGLVFAEVINHFQEFDEHLPVLTINEPDYVASVDPTEKPIFEWWDAEDEILPWYEMEDEWDMRGYTWDDVEEEKLSEYRTDAMDGLEEYEWCESSMSASENDSESESDSSSGSYEEETVSDDDSDYQLMQAEAAGLQLDVEALRAQQETIVKSHSPTATEPAILSPKSPGARKPASGGSSPGGDATPVSRRGTPRRTSRASALVAVAKAAGELATPDLSNVKDEPKEVPKTALPPQPPAPPTKKELDDSDHPQFRTPKPSGDAVLPANPPRPPPSPDKLSRKTFTESKKAEDVTQKKQRRGSEASKRSQKSTTEAPKKNKKKKRDSTTSIGGVKGPKRHASKDSSHKKKVVAPKQRQPRPPREVGPNGAKNYEWDRPDWVKENKLKQTKKGRLVRKGANLAKPITMINRAMNDMMDAKRMASRPSWSDKSEILNETNRGDALKSGGNLARNITHITSDPDAKEKFGWQKPDWTKTSVVKESEKGAKMKKGEYISAGITHIKDDQQVTSKYGWEKPDWTKQKVTKSTKEGEKVKKGESAEINADAAKEKYGWEKPDWALKQFRRVSSSTDREIDAAKEQIQTRNKMNIKRTTSETAYDR